MFRAMHLSLLGCLLGTSGCHGLPPAPPAPSAAVGNYGEVIDYLQRHIRREMERQDVPGLALALVDDQQLVWARGFGYADRQHRINASEHTAFHAGDLLFANGRHKERQLLRKHSVEEMFRQQNAGNALDFDCQVGLAWFLSPCGSAPLEGGIRHYEYASATRGFSAHLILLPEQRLAAIVMSNADDSGSLTASLARQAASLMLQVKQGARRPAVQPTPARAPALKVPSPEDRRQLYGRYATRQGQIRLYERRGRLYADFGEQRVELLRDTSGWLQMRKRLLGFWPVGVDSAGQLQLDVVSYGQRRILVSRRHDQTAYLGERIEPTSLPQAWNEAVGTYRVASTGRHSYLNGLSIRIEDGFLLVRGQAGGTRSGEFILQPIDSAHAVLAGSGQGLGDTFSRDFDGLNALGYRFAQQDTKARPWLQRKESP